MKNETQTHAANPADNAPAQHTPGPWNHTPGQDTIWAKDGGLLIARTDYTRGQMAVNEDEANARLIASAPRLKRERDELLGLLRIAETYVVAGAESTPYHAEHNAFLSDLRALIARIEKGGAS